MSKAIERIQECYSDISAAKEALCATVRSELPVGTRICYRHGQHEIVAEIIGYEAVGKI